MQGRGKQETPEKTCVPAASSGTIPTCENPAATPPGNEPGAPTSPPTKVNLVQYPAGSLPDYFQLFCSVRLPPRRTWLNTQPGHSRITSNSSVPFASHQGEPGSIPSRVTPGLLPTLLFRSPPTKANLVKYPAESLPDYFQLFCSVRLPPRRTWLNTQPGHSRITSNSSVPFASHQGEPGSIPSRVTPGLLPTLLFRSPPTKANLVKYPAESLPDYFQLFCSVRLPPRRTWLNTQPGHSRITSNSSVPFASHQGEPGSIPSRVTPGLLPTLLFRSPPTKANLVQCPGGSLPDYFQLFCSVRLPPRRTWFNTQPGHSRITSNSSVPFASHQGEHGSMPGRCTPGLLPTLLNRSPPTKANRVQSPEVPPGLLPTLLYHSPPPRRTGFNARAGHSRITSNSSVPFASHQGEPGSMPGRCTPGLLPTLLYSSPPTKANLVQCPGVALPDYFQLFCTIRLPPRRTWFNARALHSRITSNSSVPFASHQGEPGSMPGRCTPGLLPTLLYHSPPTKANRVQSPGGSLPDFANGKLGAAVAVRLACLPSTNTNRVQSPAGSLSDFRMCESCRTKPLLGGVSRGSPVPPTLSFRRCSILTLIVDSQDLAIKSHPNLFTHSSLVRVAVASRLACSSPTKAKRIHSPAGRCRWSAGFLRDLPFSPLLHSCAPPNSPRLTFIGSQDHDVKSSANLFTHKRTQLNINLHSMALTRPFTPPPATHQIEGQTRYPPMLMSDLRADNPSADAVAKPRTPALFPCYQCASGGVHPNYLLGVDNHAHLPFTIGATVAERLATSSPIKAIRVQSRPGHSGFSHVGIVADDVDSRRIFSGISRFPRPFIPALLHYTHIDHLHRL
ncbi:hypothetical protein PR048_014114 [Dryococelus australis]|uniref:Uncharacterized protein n=1 Tax=Dryococelus australis TaxID=614101 RepID=A0ABQ9HDB2_9NEOP|nr:hypothetical protein PR048_014114 [Dryococelus australis]